jgi:hypothetical protein
MSAIWQELFTTLGTKLLHSTSYHPQTDGQTERVNQCLEMFLRCSVHQSQKQWKQWLPLAELWYNSNFHSSIGCSPFKALYGSEPNLGVLTNSFVKDTSMMDIIKDREEHIEMLSLLHPKIE